MRSQSFTATGTNLSDAFTIETPSAGQPGSCTEHRDVLMLLVGVVGVKLNVGGPWLLRANVLFRMTCNGLEPGITPTIGLERAF
jgi:hypothetical protein